MAYLIDTDYLLHAQQKEIDNLTSQNSEVRILAEKWAKSELIAQLKQRYDVDNEFEDTFTWSPLTVYYANQLVQLNYPQYLTNYNYVANDLVVNNGKAYICLASTTGTFDPLKWTLLGGQYDLFYVTFPKPEFNLYTKYQIGDQVFWKNKIYTCLVETVIPDHITSLQYSAISRIPLYNVFPDDVTNGQTYWGVGTPYQVNAGTQPSDKTKWTKGDNRSSQCVNHMVRLALYNMTFRISPNNVPEHRKKAYDEAMQWLLAVSHGNINADIQEVQPTQGMPIMWGGNVRRINQW